MALSDEMRRLHTKWRAGNSWPKRLEWLEITNIRGWTGQRIDLSFPIVGIVGENGSGKSTVLQTAAAVYRGDLFASDFFPDTPFERVTAATIRFSFREGQNSQTRTVRKPTDRWRGNPERPVRPVSYVDLSRIQPVGARVGYPKLLKAGVVEGQHTAFNDAKRARLSGIMGKAYVTAGTSVTSVDARRKVPVLTVGGTRYSGFHQGAGEIAAAELLAVDIPKYGLVLIDEIETSLHPRAQRRLIRDLATVARLQEAQILLTTHSPYVLDELPPEGRIYLMEGAAGRTAVIGVSPEFAMTRMDDEAHPEVDVYVEDTRGVALVTEVLAFVDRDALARTRIIPYGAANVGLALGQMASQDRFPRPSVVFLDGDQAAAPGCHLLPGEDAPERVLFASLEASGWPDIAGRIGRQPAETIDALNNAKLLPDHHEWVASAGNRLVYGGEMLWQAMCASWATNCATDEQRNAIAQPIMDALP